MQPTSDYNMNTRFNFEYRYRTYFLQNERLLVVRQESRTQLAISTGLKWLPVRLRILPSFRMQENLQHSELLVSKNLSGVKVGCSLQGIIFRLFF